MATLSSLLGAIEESSMDDTARVAEINGFVSSPTLRLLNLGVARSQNRLEMLCADGFPKKILVPEVVVFVVDETAACR